MNNDMVSYRFILILAAIAVVFMMGFNIASEGKQKQIDKLIELVKESQAIAEECIDSK